MSGKLWILATILLFLIAVVLLCMLPWDMWFILYLLLLFLVGRFVLSRKAMSVKLWILGAILFFLIIAAIIRARVHWAAAFILLPLLVFLSGLLAFSFSDVVRKILFCLEDRKRKTKKA